MRSEYETKALVIAERGSTWGDWLAALRDLADDVTVVAQSDGESYASFAARVRAEVLDLRLEGDLVAAALVGGSAWDSSVLSSRSLILRVLSKALLRGPAGRIFLDEGAAEGRGRFAMQALAQVVEDQVGGGVRLTTTAGAPSVARPAVARVVAAA